MIVIRKKGLVAGRIGSSGEARLAQECERHTCVLKAPDRMLE
jgi:hypothetical protein